MLAERYRIVGILGRGGMGEVYRADDLKLRQPVALKFLPVALTADPSRLDRFHHEVRVARQVSHPNVCRVYDIGEADGQHFISMEYVDGEDLASLLRRMGRPSQDKAIQIARQLCAGLAAAHERGVLHRDLKPHNIMIDGVGRVRVTDFGLAGFAKDFTGAEVRAGTPAYMAPEQLAGREVSVKSDLYSLGLVLFELFTGKRADQVTEGGPPSRSRSSLPATLTNLAPGMDPTVERVILRCLEPEPASRPSSALAVAAALPGGDPLAAALEAGETPSPEMVANAAEIGGLKPAVAISCLVIALAGIVAHVLLIAPDALPARVTFPNSPQELHANARQMLTTLGYSDRPEHRRSGFVLNEHLLSRIEKADKTTSRWDNLATLRPPPVGFWYRESPENLAPVDFHAMDTTVSDPPQSNAGSITLLTDPQGRLIRLEVLPASSALDCETTGIDWGVFFEQAGLERTDWSDGDVIRAPVVPADSFRAWRYAGSDEALTGLAMQAGTFAGLPTYFELFASDDPTSGEADESPAGPPPAVALIASLLIGTVILGALLLARRNLRLGRSDRKGALRLMFFVTISFLFAWCLVGIHIRGAELNNVIFDLVFGRPLGHALAHAGIVCILYVALEPYVRRLWPTTLVSWNRLLMGRFKDPMLGRDVLLGGVFATGFILLGYAGVQFSAAIGLPPARLNGQGIVNGTMLGLRECLSVLAGMLAGVAFLPLLALVFLLIARTLLRRTWAAAAALVIIMTVVQFIGMDDLRGLATGQLALWLGFSALWTALMLVVLLRFGLVAAVSAFLVIWILNGFPVSDDLSTWYAGSTLFAFTILIGAFLYGFFVSLAGRPIFKDLLAD